MISSLLKRIGQIKKLNFLIFLALFFLCPEHGGSLMQVNVAFFLKCYLNDISSCYSKKL